MREELEKKKEYLRKFESAQKAIERLDDNITQLRLMKMCPSVNMDGMPHSSGISDLSGYAAMIDEYEQELVSLRYKRMVEYQKVAKSIEQLEDERMKSILHYRYLKFKKWEDICVKLEISWRNIHRLHAQALINLEIN